MERDRPGGEVAGPFPLYPPLWPTQIIALAVSAIWSVSTSNLEPTAPSAGGTAETGAAPPTPTAR